MSRKPVWTEGLFITQHHLQQLDRYHESLVDERLRSTLPFAWGVNDLQIDERSLGAGQLRVARLSAVFPGGTVVAAGDGQVDTIAPRPFDGVFTPQMPVLDVYVALPQEAEGLPSVGLDGVGSASTRFARGQELVRDLNTGGSEQPVDVARPNLRLLFGDERRGGFDTIRIAQLARAATGHVIVRETYVAPVLQLSASPYLAKSFRALLTAMTARQRAVAESRRQRQAGAIELDAGDIAKFWLLGTLNTFIPTIAHLVDSPTAHPEQAYLVLGQLIGQLCTLAADGDPTTIPKFNYLDLGAVFEPMFARVMQLIGAAIQERCIEIPLQRRPDGVYVGKAQGPEVMRSEFFVAVSTTLPEGQIRERLPRLIKVASTTQIGAILHSAVSGAVVELEYRPPSALPIKPGITWFRLTRTPEFWADISATGTFAIYHPFDPHALNLALYAVDSQNLK